MICIRCRKLIENTDKKTCDSCIAHVDEKMICGFCGDIYTRTNRTRHKSSFKCQSRHGELYVYVKGVLNTSIQSY